MGATTVPSSRAGGETAERDRSPGRTEGLGGSGRPGLVSRDWLSAHLDDADVVVVEVDVGPAAYDQGHIPGAVLWDIYRDLKDDDYRLRGGDELQDLVARSGIDPGSTVVFYGYGPAFGLWLLRRSGHPGAVLLDGSRAAWSAEERAWTAEVVAPARGTFRLGSPDGRVGVTLDQVSAAVGDGMIDNGEVGLFDVRTVAEYDGERFWPSGGMEPDGRAGHVPGAVRVAVDDLLEGDGSFRPIDELAARFAPALARTNGRVITYCTIGARAALAWFVLVELLGRPDVAVYDGSWAEWGRRADVAVATT